MSRPFSVGEFALRRRDGAPVAILDVIERDGEFWYGIGYCQDANRVPYGEFPEDGGSCWRVPHYELEPITDPVDILRADLTTLGRRMRGREAQNARDKKQRDAIAMALATIERGLHSACAEPDDGVEGES